MKTVSMIFTVLVLLVLTWAAPAAEAQASASYRVEESVFNAGGRPHDGQTSGSTSYGIGRDSVGDALHAVSMASASYRIDTGFGAIYTPPGLVDGLHFVSGSALAWLPASFAGSYNLYRGSLASVGNYGDCLLPGLPTTTASDGEDPAAGVTWFYLVTASNFAGDEGGKGADSSGSPRGGNACP